MKAAVASLVLLHAIAIHGIADEEEVRTWSDTSGKFSLQAKYISCDDYQVTLQKSNGESLTIPATRLCDQDQKYVGACVLETQKLPKEMADLLAYLEVCRDAAIVTLERQKTVSDALAQNGDAAVDQEALDRYNEFRAKNPNYGLPQGFEDQFGANSRERVESARASEKQRQAAKIKAIDGAIKELKKSLFVPTYTVRDFEQQLEAVSSLVHEKMFRDKGLNADADALQTAVRLNYKSVGHYKLRVRVDSVLDEKIAIVRARTGDDGAFDFSDVFCLECDPQSIRVDSEFELPSQLYFAKALTKVSYATGENTSVSNQTVLVLAPCPFTPEQLEDEFNRSKRMRATSFDPKREAMARFQKAKLLLKSGKLNGVSQMREIVAKFPGTTIVDPFTGHEAPGDLASQFQIRFRKHMFSVFQSLIDDYNDVVTASPFAARIDEYVASLEQTSQFALALRDAFAPIETLA